MIAADPFCMCSCVYVLLKYYCDVLNYIATCTCVLVFVFDVTSYMYCRQ